MSGQNFQSIQHLVEKIEFRLENRGPPSVISGSVHLVDEYTKKKSMNVT